MDSGIYCVRIPRPDGTDLYYYGQSSQLARRERDHLRHLVKGIHDNVRVQRAFDKHGQATFEVVCYAPVTRLDALEQAFLDRYFDDADCLNLAHCAEAPARGRTVSAETRRKISKSVSRAMTGRKHSPETRRRMSEAQKGKVVSAETRRRMSVAAKQRPRTTSA